MLSPWKSCACYKEGCGARCEKGCHVLENGDAVLPERGDAELPERGDAEPLSGGMLSPRRGCACYKEGCGARCEEGCCAAARRGVEPAAIGVPCRGALTLGQRCPAQGTGSPGGPVAPSPAAQGMPVGWLRCSRC